MKILYVTTISNTIKFFTHLFETLISEGHTIDIACNLSAGPVPEFCANLGCKSHHIPVSRSPFDADNIKAVKELQRIVDESDYDIVHCHTPVAAACARVACRKARKRGVRVFYTAHGFHFYKGAPLKNWLLYYPVEKVLARYTDLLITINKEDDELARKKLKAKKIQYVKGVGINLEKFTRRNVDTLAKRKEFDIPPDAKWVLNIGELITRKNHETLIRAIAEIDNVYLTIAGRGVLHDYLTDLINNLGVSDRVKLIGYRKDIPELCSSCDAFVFSSFHEGLPVSVMEAMASGLPVACSRIRGNVELIDDNGGVLFDPHSVPDCKAAIKSLLSMDFAALSAYNLEKIKGFDVNMIIDVMRDLYTGALQ